MTHLFSVALWIAVIALGVLTNPAHPGSGLAVDRQGTIFFTDTGQGVWRIELSGEISLVGGPAYHWMAIDRGSSLAAAAWPQFEEPSAKVEKVEANPTLLAASDFPIATGVDGALYYPELGSDQRLRVYRATASEERSVFATMPSGPGEKHLRWLNGMASGGDGSIFFTENAAVRRINPQGLVSTIAENIEVGNGMRIPGAAPALGPLLRGLDIASDGTIYVAASACSAVLKIAPGGRDTNFLTTEAPWSPTSVAASGSDIYVLEYLHASGGDRREWLPRVRKISAHGSNRIIARIERTGPESSRAVKGATGGNSGER